MSLEDAIKVRARELGFDLVGIAEAATPPSAWERFQAWLAEGYAGTMDYMESRADAVAQPAKVLPGVRSVVMLGINYRRAPEAPTNAVGRVSGYARIGADYHDVLRPKLRALGEFVRQNRPGTVTRGIVDTAPFLEREFARLAGLGWFGKNTMLLNKRLGSEFFLAALLCTCELTSDAPHAASHCGTCTRCLEACPTDAFPRPGVLDARKCISYLTIEHRGPIDRELRAGMGDWLFGCDVCQEVCPWTRKAPASHAFPEARATAEWDAAEVLRLSHEELAQRIRGTPLARPGTVGLKRNAAIVLGNAAAARPESASRAIPVLAAAARDESSIVREAARWGLERIGLEDARTALAQVTADYDLRGE